MHEHRHTQARVDGKALDGIPTVLSLCTHNAGRSQMSLGFFTPLLADQAVAWSGGFEPGTQINPAAVTAMRERGLDDVRPIRDEIERRVRRLLDELAVQPRETVTPSSR